MPDDEFQPRGDERRSTDSLVAAAQAETKPKKRIVTNVTVHVPGPDHRPYVLNDLGRIVDGQYHDIAFPPGHPVELDAAEADRILARHGGEEVEADYEVPVSVGQPVENRRAE